MEEKIEYHGQNCYIATSGMCFLERINCFTTKNFAKVFRELIRDEKHRSGVMTSARIQSLCAKI